MDTARHSIKTLTKETRCASCTSAGWLPPTLTEVGGTGRSGCHSHWSVPSRLRAEGNREDREDREDRRGGTGGTTGVWRGCDSPWSPGKKRQSRETGIKSPDHTKARQRKLRAKRVSSTVPYSLTTPGHTHSHTDTPARAYTLTQGSNQ